MTAEGGFTGSSPWLSASWSANHGETNCLHVEYEGTTCLYSFVSRYTTYNENDLLYLFLNLGNKDLAALETVRVRHHVKGPCVIELLHAQMGPPHVLGL
jgi:hypothetical protein